MAKIKPSKAFEKLISNGFGGIRYASAMTGESASETLNFRIASDGSLEKRNGITTRYQLEGPVRAVWQGSLDGGNYLIAVAGSRVYVRPPGQDAPTVCNLLPSDTDPVFLIPYRGTLYLFARSVLYRFMTLVNCFNPADGYAPLYGENWHPTQLGSVNEPLNMVTPHIRIRYLNSTGSTEFHLPYTTVSIDHMEVDGVSFHNYTFTPNSTTFRIPTDKAHGVLTVAVTISSVFSERSVILGVDHGYVFSDASHETLLLYGGNSGYRVFDSSPVTEEMLADAEICYRNDTDPLYFRQGCGLYIGDRQHPIHALCRDRNRVIALNDRSAWAIEYAGDDLLSYPLEGGVGCSSPGGLALCGNHPVAVSENGVFLLKFPSGESDVCVATALAEGVAELFPRSLLENGILTWDPGRAELWLRDPGDDAEGLVWVLNPEKREWYRFDNIPATVFFTLDGSVAFGTSDGRLAISDSDADTDDGDPITATYRSHFLAFSEPETKKRAYRLSVCADTGGESLFIRIETDRQFRTFWATGNASDKPDFFDYRVAAGRFRFLRYTLTAIGVARTRIYRLSVFANR